MHATLRYARLITVVVNGGLIDGPWFVLQGLVSTAKALWFDYVHGHYMLTADTERTDAAFDILNL